MNPELARLGVSWQPSGHCGLTGPALALAQRLDRLFCTWADHWQAAEHAFPPFLPSAALARTDYFSSFHHLATFPVSLAADEATLRRFAELNAHPLGPLELGALAPADAVLTPAACYHVYLHLQDSTLTVPGFFTTKATCYRREHTYSPLQRQRSFGMRELVCVGDAATVQDFTASMQAQLADFFARCALPITFEPATDPFFLGAQHPKSFLQRLDPVKLEMVFAGRLALGSINFHRNYFGEAFTIRCQGKAAFSGCVAFGIERWLYAITEQFGFDPRHWPEPFAPAASSV